MSQGPTIHVAILKKLFHAAKSSYLSIAEPTFENGKMGQYVFQPNIVPSRLDVCNPGLFLWTPYRELDRRPASQGRLVSAPPDGEPYIIYHRHLSKYPNELVIREALTVRFSLKGSLILHMGNPLPDHGECCDAGTCAAAPIGCLPNLPIAKRTATGRSTL